MFFSHEKNNFDNEKNNKTYDHSTISQIPSINRLVKMKSIRRGKTVCCRDTILKKCLSMRHQAHQLAGNGYNNLS